MNKEFAAFNVAMEVKFASVTDSKEQHLELKAALVVLGDKTEELQRLQKKSEALHRLYLECSHRSVKALKEIRFFHDEGAKQLAAARRTHKALTTKYDEMAARLSELEAKVDASPPFTFSHSSSIPRFNLCMPFEHRGLSKV